MGPSIVARNYADTLMALAQRHGGLATMDEYARALDDLVRLLQREPRIREFLKTPRVDGDAKREAVRAALAGRVPELFLRFVLVVIEKRRQGLLGQIAAAYHDRVDEVMNRVRAEITLAHEPDAVMRDEIRAALEQRLGKQVVPTFRVDAELIGGVIVRVADDVFDGSIQRQIGQLRRRLVGAELPPLAATVREKGNFEC